MSAPMHTPEPWFAGWGAGITGPYAAAMLRWDGKYPIYYECRGHRYPLAALTVEDPLHKINAERIVACVNACAGMDDPAEIIRGLTIARETLGEVAKQRDELLNERDLLRDQLAEWRRQRDELLEGLQRIARNAWHIPKVYDDHEFSEQFFELAEIAEKAMAKVQL